MNIVYTVCNRTNLSHALLLAESLLKHQPESRFYLCWVDPLPLEKLSANVYVIRVEETGIPDLGNMQQSYYHFELLAACRPWFALALLDKHPECSLLTFYAPTVQIMHPVDTIVSEEKELFLTPHLTRPMVSNNHIDDKRILNIGMFHSGSWALRPAHSTRMFLSWWAERTLDRASFDLCDGMNQDQLWLNYAPIWVKETVLMRHAGWHYGLHAVPNRNLVKQNNQYLVEGQPLLTLDFAGLDVYDPVWSDHVGLLSRNRTFQQLFRDYQQNLGKFAGYQPSGSLAGYGQILTIPTNRLFKKQMAEKLKSLTSYIDQF